MKKILTILAGVLALAATSCVKETLTMFDPSKATEQNLMREDLSAVLDTLGTRERQVLDYRYGLTDGNCRTLEEVGRLFNVTRERVRQIEAKALRMLRHPSRMRRLRDIQPRSA